MCYWCCFRQKYGRTVPARRDSRSSRASRRDSRRWSIFTIFMKDVQKYIGKCIEFEILIFSFVLFSRLPFRTRWILPGSRAFRKTVRLSTRNSPTYRWSQSSRMNCHRALRQRTVTPTSYLCRRRGLCWIPVVLGKTRII